MTTYGAAYEVLTGGRWVVTKAGVKVWEWACLDLPRSLDLPPLPQVEHTDMHDLFACLTCSARVDEACRTTSGERVTDARNGAHHAGRLTPRLCRCGGSVVDTARKCLTCLRRDTKVMTQQKRRQIARAVERERMAS